jgi:hypothetical protein
MAQQTLYGPTGRELDLSTFKKAAPPKLGPAFGDWAGRDFAWNQMPGGSILQFDLSTLTLADFRAMRYHPQVNASLSLLTFIIHQVDWSIECKDQKIADEVEENIRDMWTRIVRAISQAFWAGFSPSILEFENNPNDGLDIVLSKVKDMYPEDCRVHWEDVEGAKIPGKPDSRPQKLKVYDGIDVLGQPGPIPPDHTLWYPLLMENGDYYGRKLLKACFTPWYFSTLIHLFANRYYERFGEPLPIGRAPFDQDIELSDGTTVTSRDAMETILRNLRSRATVTLPSERDPVTKEFDYEIEYLESQMRGADFERYLTRLDEEISLGLFTPLLLLKTGDVGSHNAVVQHTQTWLWMVNSLTADLAEYITRYITDRLKAINFTPNAPVCRWVPRPMGKENVETLRALAVELVRGGKARPDLEEMGQSLGMTMREVRETTEPEAAPAADVDDRQRTERVRAGQGQPRGVGEARATGRAINNRMKPQIEKAFRDNKFDADFKPDFGFRRRFVTALEADGLDHEEAVNRTDSIYEKLNDWVAEATDLGAEEFGTSSDFMALFERRLDSLIEEHTNE